MVWKMSKTILLCLVLVFVAGCVIEEHIYVKVFMPVGSPPVFRISDSSDFRTPALVDTISVFYYESEDAPLKECWSILAGKREIRDSKVYYVSSQPIAIWEVVYGVVPEGFVEFEEETKGALPLEPGREYGVEVRGGTCCADQTAYFIYRPE